MEPIALHPDSPYYFQFRTQMLLGADVELRVIRDRTRFGMVSAAKSGRYIAKAPIGYINERDSQNKPIITIDAEKGELIKKVFHLYLTGMPIIDIQRLMNAPLKLKGNSAIKRILTNHVYAGLIKVPSYYDEPEGIVKGIHDGLVDKDAFFSIQDLLNGKVQVHTSFNEEVPFRGVLYCHCGHILTAGLSKGRSKHYWYYKCPNHKENYSSTKLHSKMLDLLEELTLRPAILEALKNKVDINLKEERKKSLRHREGSANELSKINEQLDSLEYKYISNEIDPATYKKWLPKLKTQKGNAEAALKQSNPADHSVIDFVFSKISSLKTLYQDANVYRKQALIRLLFGTNLFFEKDVYRTAFLSPAFLPKALILKQKRFLEIQETVFKKGVNPVSAPGGT